MIFTFEYVVFVAHGAVKTCVTLEGRWEEKAFRIKTILYVLVTPVFPCKVLLLKQTKTISYLFQGMMQTSHTVPINCVVEELIWR